MKNRLKIHIGTSGWSYIHWRENFYPKSLKPNQWLNYYSSVFSTVEINTTFYHTPLPSTVMKWYAEVPKDFLFSVKANRYITHQKRLNDCKESLYFFYKSIQKLQAKVGPSLFQLPPSFKINKERLREFMLSLSDQYDYAIEFRHPSWFTPEIYDLLSQNRVALCLTDLNGELSPLEITSHFTYIRLHGPQQSYSGSYSTRQLKFWKTHIEKWVKAKTSVYCYFDNDEKGYAIADAKRLKALLSS